jgi:hypothetical protein
MLAQDTLDREDAGTTVFARSGGAADRRDRAGALVSGAAYGAVVDDSAVADDHEQ